MDGPTLPSRAEAGVSRILVIDDDQDLGRVIRRVLELEGYEVVLSDDGLRGLAAAQRQRPDAIVLDLMMPVMDGYQVLAELRDDERTKDVPVVVLTAVALDETRERVEAAGAATFLTKPFEPKNLSRALASLVGSSAAD
jgi:CheY-like chemotaxis protein